MAEQANRYRCLWDERPWFQRRARLDRLFTRETDRPSLEEQGVDGTPLQTIVHRPQLEQTVWLKSLSCHSRGGEAAA